MNNISDNNKRLTKNTLLLYFRMFITMAIGLYTSRVVLSTLGISDYGVYNVVGGFITLLSFLNSAMISASQRFIAFELGKNNLDNLKKVFCTTTTIHIAIAIIAIIFAETIGLWFINNKLNIEPERMVAANWVYQCSVLTFAANIISVPYNSSIVAHEKMSAFAYISILEVTLKLIIVYLLQISPIDKLIAYSILLLLVSLVIRYCYTYYCTKHFQECIYKFYIDKELFNKMFSFVGWSLMGNLGFSVKDQASNVILNIFYGTSLNAARGIGLQVSTIINTFSSNFTMALNPQITKQYASGNIENSINLVYAGSKYSFYLLTLISIPVIINVNYILSLWLESVPQHTSFFLILAILTGLLYTLSGSITIAIQATGKIKTFQIGICILMLSEIPMTYILLKLGYPPYSVMYPTLLTYSLAILFRFYLIKKLVIGYKYKHYLLNVVCKCITIFILCWLVCHFICSIFKETFITFIIKTIITIIVTITIIYILGINNSEKQIIKKGLKHFITKH